MIKFVSRRKKDYSRHNILQRILADVPTRNNIVILLPFSKKKFFSLIARRKHLINDFFISDYDTYAFDRKKGSKISPSALYKFFLDWINFRFSRYLLCDTQTHFDYWQSLFGEFRGQHHVFPVLADPEIYYPAAQPPENKIPKILFYGYFIPLHGIDVILKALKQCEAAGHQFQAVLIGNGQTFSQMQALALQLQLKHVEFNGKLIPETELADEIRNSDIVLGIFGSSQKSRSVVPNKVYQALACGKATITQDSPAIREFFSERDLNLVTGTPEALAKAIQCLLHNPNQRQSLAQSGYTRYQKLWKQHTEQLRKFIMHVDKHIDEKHD